MKLYVLFLAVFVNLACQSTNQVRRHDGFDGKILHDMTCNDSTTVFATFTGRVVDVESPDTPICNAAVWLQGSVVRGTYTDQKGYFQIRNIPSGRYKFSTSRLFYRSLKTDSVFVKTTEHRVFEIGLFQEITGDNDSLAGCGSWNPKSN